MCGGCGPCVLMHKLVLPLCSAMTAASYVRSSYAVLESLFADLSGMAA